MQVVIIGNSAAGLSALRALRRLDGDCRITMISDEDMPAYSRVLTPYWISGETKDVFIRNMDFYRRMGVRTLFGRRAVRITTAGVELQDGQRVSYDRLLIATGACAHFPPLPGLRVPGVFALRTIDDARRIAARAKIAKKALFLGGGLVCLQGVRALQRLGLQITVAVSSDRILSRMLDRHAAEIIQRRMEQAGINVLTGTEITQVCSNGTGVTGVVTSRGRAIEADLVIVAKGVRSNAAVAADSGIGTKRGVLVDRAMRTDWQNVYAAGDVAESPDLLIPDKRTICATWFEAVYQGEVAGCGMAGRNVPYGGSLKMNVMESMGIPVASIGLTEPVDRSDEVMVSSGTERYRKLIVRDGRIVGAILVGDVRDAGIIVSLLRRGTPLATLGKSDPRLGFRFGGMMHAVAVRAAI